MIHHARLLRTNGFLEAVCWVVAIVLLALMNPMETHLFSLCPWSWVTDARCPGCGLGHSIAFLFRGEWRASWEAHILGLPALLILGRRIFSLLWLCRTQIRNQLTNNHHAKRF
ncbi:DUF2752 domain-containing protein [Pontibacter sp. JH31]|uniref:DUF2752 domain-containing protein n=2 Tax=Pontibacter aquaedesilientis TaxID=2766980 RepID=A0ABR7XIC5_9BACT|nr:DUF2752 domain-containing protein [Pontibacter aquaedesilientis]